MWSAKEIEESIRNWKWKALRAKWFPVLSRITPCPESYVMAAKSETERDCQAEGTTPNAGLFMAKLQGLVQLPPEKLRAPRPQQTGPVSRQEVALRRMAEFEAANPDAFKGMYGGNHDTS